MEKVTIEQLNKSLRNFAKLQNQDLYERVLYFLFMYAKNDGTVHVPTTINRDNEMCFGLVKTTDGYYYEVCTTSEELIKCPEESSALMRLDKIIARTSSDDEIKGICVNPYGLHPFFLPKQYIKQILANTQE